MQAMAEAVIKKWKSEGINTIMYRFDNNGTGKLVQHQVAQMRQTRLSALFTTAELAILLYVDGSALCFETRSEMIRGKSIIQQQMDNFGLEMHVGT